MGNANLSNYIKFNSDFRNAINLYLSLNKPEKVLGYIPTKSSVKIINDYVEAVIDNKNHASLLIGPYGKGKSHLLLVLLSILSLERNVANTEIISTFIHKIEAMDDNCNDITSNINRIWKEKKRFLPIILMSGQGDLNQSFLLALSDALKREGLAELTPDTYYSHAINNINVWNKEYRSTYDKFEEMLKEKNYSVNQMIAGLAEFSKEYLDVFCEVYPQLTSGSVFNPMATAEVLPLYKSICNKLCDEYEYSGIYIVFDEFSKYIESQNNKLVGSNMKLLQDMCELAAESKNSQLFITMVAHKSIKEYGKFLTSETINSFTGIEGRLQEKYFITSSKNNYELIQNAIIKDQETIIQIPDYENLLGQKALKDYYKIPYFRMNFTEDDFNRIVLKGCYPLSPISSYLLLNISEKVAQNERTLFTFISKDEPNSLRHYVQTHNSGQSWVVNADLVYDYFSSLFKKDINNEFIHNEWLNAEYAISKCKDIPQEKMLKTLAIMNIVNKEEEIPPNREYLQLASGLNNPSEVLMQLEKLDLIYQKKSTNCYVFKTRAGSELKNEIRKRREIKGDVVNINKALLDTTDDYFILPKQYNQQFSMTRYFRHEFMQVDHFLAIENINTIFDENEFCDGKVLSLYSLNDKDYFEEVKEVIKKLNSLKLIVKLSVKPFKVLKYVRDYEIIQELKADQLFFDSIEVLQSEIPIYEEDLGNVVKREVESLFGSDSGYQLIYFQNNEICAIENGNVNIAVNLCCSTLYHSTPIINNELINKRELSSSQIKKTRKNIIEYVLSKSEDPTFYLGTNQEATVYRGLFVNTGIVNNNMDSRMAGFLSEIDGFINKGSDEKQLLNKLISLLEKEPYAVRLSIIPIYLAYVISNRKEDIIIYFKDFEVQLTSDIVINMCEKPHDYMMFVSKEDIEKEKYIYSLQDLFDVDRSVNISDTRIRNIHRCMQTWFRALPQVTRTLDKSGKYDKAQSLIDYMVKFRNLIQKVDGNPYEIIFVEIPKVFKCDGNYSETIKKLKICKACYDEYYDWLNNTLVSETIKIFDRKENSDLYHTLKEWYERQSSISKKGLHDGRITNFMTCIENLNTYDELSVVQKVIKAVTNVYVENWYDSSYGEYLRELNQLKEAIEGIKDHDTNKEKFKLEFIGNNSKKIERYYEKVDEKTGSVLRNIIEDTLDDFDDLSVNDKVAILLEMIELVIK